MDVAAQQITQLVQRVLPQRPHHLSVSLDDRYHVPPQGVCNVDSPLQFTTYVSDADRGLLNTRPYYDIQIEREEATKEAAKKSSNGTVDSRPDKAHASTDACPASTATPTAADSGKGETKKKRTLKDYQQNKQQKKAPDSPQRPTAPSAHPAPADEKPSRTADVMGTLPGHRLPPKPEFTSDRKYNRSPKSPRPYPSANATDRDSRKRVADPHDANRPHKRSRSDTSMSSDSPPPPARSRPHNPPSPLDLNSRRDDRPRHTQNAQSLPRPRDYPSSHATPSPSVPRSNGHNHRADGSRDRDYDRGRSRDRSPDYDTVKASGLPPILSPLHFNPDRDLDMAAKRPRPSTGASGVPSKLPSKPKPARADSPLHIPPLLSPTLPAIVEQELTRRLEKAPAKPGAAQKASEEPFSSVAGKKPARPAAEREREEVHKDVHEHKDHPRESQRDPPRDLPRETQREPTRETAREPANRLLVVLKYKKKNAKRVERLLKLQPTPMKAPAKRIERSPSAEEAPAPLKKKRPLPSDNISSDPPSSSSFKHPRTVAEKSISTVRASAGPATPHKTTPMVRVTSSNSQTLTPGDSTSFTPRSNERPPTSQSDLASGTTVTEYRHRYDNYLKVGTKIKHGRDAIVKNRLPNGSAKSADGSAAPVPNLVPSEKKLVAVLSLEMVMSYMIAFKSLNQGRYLERKGGDIMVWERLMPHLAELRSHARHYRPLEGLALQLRAICFEQMLTAFNGHDAESVAARLLKASKSRTDAWMDAYACVDSVSDSSLKVVVGPWLGVEDTIRVMLPAVRRWCDHERVSWEQELQLPKIP